MSRSIRPARLLSLVAFATFSAMLGAAAPAPVPIGKEKEREPEEPERKRFPVEGRGPAPRA